MAAAEYIDVREFIHAFMDEYWETTGTQIDMPPPEYHIGYIPNDPEITSPMVCLFRERTESKTLSIGAKNYWRQTWVRAMFFSDNPSEGPLWQRKVERIIGENSNSPTTTDPDYSASNISFWEVTSGNEYYDEDAPFPFRTDLRIRLEYQDGYS
jgi:hypothetical protein